MISLHKNFGFIFSILLIAAINLFLITLPLTNLIGYEFSIINSLLISFVGGLYSISFFKDGKSYFSGLAEASGKIFLFLCVPFLIGFINHALFEFCPFTNDIFFYLLITIPAFFISTMLAYWTVGISGKYNSLIFILIYLHFIFIPIWEIFKNPQIYFYNPVIVFFPGNIYDEDISITSQMICYRIITIILYGLFVLFAPVEKKHPVKYALRFIPVIIISLFIYFKPVLGFATDNSRMENHLNVIYETENFKICFSPKIEEQKRKNIILQHEFHFRDIKSKYGLEEEGQITSYVFENGDEKREYFGAKNADVAKPWLRSIYINSENYFNSLRHEIAHIFSARFGVTPFKVASWFNPALIEGFAMALENNYDDNTNHYLAWLAEKSGYAVDIKTLFSGQNFFANASSLSYIISGSYVQYLMQTYGASKFERIYAGDSFDNIYEKSIPELETEYKSYLDSFGFELNQSIAKTYFAHKALIQKVCPRYTANRLKEANQLYDKESYTKALRLYGEIFDYSKSYTALVGITRCYIKLYETDSAVKALTENITLYDKTAYYNNLLLRLGDYSVLINDYDSAEKYYELLENENPIIGYENVVKLRKILLLKNKSLINEYVEGNENDRYKIVSDLLETEINYNVLPTAIALCPNTEKDYKLFMNKFVDKVEIKSEYAFYAVLELGKFAIENSDYNRAKLILSKKIDYRENNGRNLIYKQYYSLAEWLAENNSIIEMDQK